MRVLDAFTARLIPSDETGPGAREAHVCSYVERALGTEYAAELDAYRRGLAATDAHARRRFDGDFADLPEDQQDTLLSEIESGEAPGFEGSFFALVRQHTIEGMFGDPAWGGNADRVGWALLGYSGPKPSWSAEEQAIEQLGAEIG